MTKRLLVGVTQRIDCIEFNNEWRDALDQRLIDWIIKSGFLPLPIPNTLVNINLTGDSQPILDNWINRAGIDAIVLSGGNDIGGIEQRDLTEQYLLSWAEKSKKPVLGICRGMQMMGVYSGSKLIEVTGHVRIRHQLQVEDGLMQSQSVNSYHNLALENCPDLFQVMAKSGDSSIEAIKHKDLPWEGWMWHPEREEIYPKDDLERARMLLNA